MKHFKTIMAAAIIFAAVLSCEKEVPETYEPASISGSWVVSAESNGEAWTELKISQVLVFDGKGGYLVKKLDSSAKPVTFYNGQVYAEESDFVQFGSVRSVTFSGQKYHFDSLPGDYTLESSTSDQMTFSYSGSAPAKGYRMSRVHKYAASTNPVGPDKPDEPELPEEPQKNIINGTELVEGNDLVGLISDKSTGKGIPGVVVSDGYDCVATDANGVYQFKSNSLTRIIYYSTPAEYQIATSNPSLPYFYKAIKPEGEVIRTDFELNPIAGGKEINWTFIGIGDPQCATSSNASRYSNETIPDIKKTLSGRSSVYAITLGDIVFDSTNMWNTMKATMSAVSTGSWYIPFFQCIGNHDHDSLQPDTNDDAMDDYTATSTFVGVFGPTDYSFNRGDVHVVVMDDIVVSKQASSSKSNGKTWNYSNGFTSKQFEWLKKDLELVPDKENKMVFICCHIPFRGSSSNYYMDVAKQLLNFKEAHIMIGHTHYTQNYVYNSATYKAKGGLYLYEHIHGSACGAWWTSSSSSTVTGEPNGYTIYDIEGAHIKDWHFKGTNKAADLQLRVYDGNEIYYQSKSYPLNWYTASQKAGSSSITVKGNVNLRYCFVAQVFNDDDTYWTVELRKKSTGEKIGSFKRLANKSCTNIAVSAYYFNVKGKNSDSYSSVTASHYWYYLPASHDPANESDWEVVATQKIPGGEVTHTYTCSELTVESDLEKTFYF